MTMYRKFKDVRVLTEEELKFVKESQFDFDLSVFGGFVICDSILYSEYLIF